MIAVAVSGGVDSLAALLILRAQGHEVLALHALFTNPVQSSQKKLAETCAAINIPLKVIDLRQEFWDLVITPTLRELQRGATPNPCMLCNRHLKFGLILDYALNLGCTHYATGHYASLKSDGTTYFVHKALDQQKDQSYFLSLTDPKRLKHCLFPLSNRQKKSCREIVAAAGISAVEPYESQDVCFYPSPAEQANYFKTQWAKLNLSVPLKGPILLWDVGVRLKEIGTHQGLWRYTEGQRRGLGIPYKEGLYVLAKDYHTNSLIVGPRSFLGMTSCITAAPNIFYDDIASISQVFVKLRYRQTPAPCHALITQEHITLNFDPPVFPTACGQVATLLDAQGSILAAGTVTELTNIVPKLV
ncbi:MAG: tRNA 2-thiouridine(34) synthase MnmA [Desulfovibrionaceae bacterium]|nr:tRNA 2-thiouridine(34) synthase MnmA [Desulfovibrionaceae bacterium]